MKKCPYCAEEIQDEAIKCRYCGSDLQETSSPVATGQAKFDSLGNGQKQIAPAKPKKKTSGCAIAVILIVGFVGFLWLLGNFSQNEKTSTLNNDATASPKLELLGYKWNKSYGYAILEGQVKNISSESLKNVAAVASFFTESGTFVTSDETLIEFNPILPGQTSPFKVMATWNPAMNNARVEFKFLMGGKILTRNSSK